MNDDTGRTVDLMGRIASHSLSAARGLQIQKFGGTTRDITWLSRTNCVTKMNLTIAVVRKADSSDSIHIPVVLKNSSHKELERTHCDLQSPRHGETHYSWTINEQRERTLNNTLRRCAEELSLELWERHSEAALKPVNMEVKPEVVKNINKMKHEVLVASKMRCRSEEKEACRVGQREHDQIHYTPSRCCDNEQLSKDPFGTGIVNKRTVLLSRDGSEVVLASSDVMKKGQNALLFNPCQCPTTDTDTVDRGCVGEELRNAEGGCLTTNNVRHSSQTCADTFFGKEVGFVEEEQVHGATNGSLALVEKESI
ncbi:hypothetical protein BLNAU_23391 [Blattamonas nauphoetae]|uniref:Uncharacterized protein n=1 Tax=Blattamonas nauphoetae TaxID=2049346 RepID=A0ABQ9WQE5_9EUKA|nr:hypothetical protein BLNAU_23391 [Blattamonas nauphoetae]